MSEWVLTPLSLRIYICIYVCICICMYDVHLAYFLLYRFLDLDAIYFPHNIDFRGRTYPIPPHLNHLGSDIDRGLLQFADKQPIGDNGMFWMKVQEELFFSAILYLSKQREREREREMQTRIILRLFPVYDSSVHVLLCICVCVFLKICYRLLFTIAGSSCESLWK